MGAQEDYAPWPQVQVFVYVQLVPAGEFLNWLLVSFL